MEFSDYQSEKTHTQNVTIVRKIFTMVHAAERMNLMIFIIFSFRLYFPGRFRPFVRG